MKVRERVQKVKIKHLTAEAKSRVYDVTKAATIFLLTLCSLLQTIFARPLYWCDQNKGNSYKLGKNFYPRNSECLWHFYFGVYATVILPCKIALLFSDSSVYFTERYGINCIQIFQGNENI